ncbi:MAG TPA: LLM class F420-dependent oxidoreductase [Anaerolineales bacterium]|nr:LLM class F420-dependent oxidoreductase [Anaerolineales bacterium]
MKIGVVFPQTEIGNDVTAIRDYAQTAEGLGYSHILAYEHVLGAAPTPENIRRNGYEGTWRGPYTHEHPFHEPFVLFAFLAGITTRIGFLTGILILPQRQTALVAKQAAELDLLSEGRLRLGVGAGWNKAEMAAMGENPENRGRRMDEQLAVLQALWTDPVVRFSGKYHNLPDVGILPLPVQRPIPLWFGGHSDEMMRRVVRFGAGWLPGYREAEQSRGWLEQLYAAAEAAGRSRDEIGLEPRIHYGEGDPDAWRRSLDGWKAIGAGYAAVNTMGAGFDSPQKHIIALERFAREVQDD